MSERKGLKQKMLNDAKNEPEFPPFWDPQVEDDCVFGTVVDIDPNAQTKYGKTTVAIIRQDNDERVSVWLTRTVLRKKWDIANPQVGDTVLVLYKGEKQKEDGGVHYYDYSVKVEREETSPKQTTLRTETPIQNYKQGLLYKTILDECTTQGGQDKDVLADRLVGHGFTMEKIREVLSIMLKDGIIAEERNNIILM